ncbi:hypothetical protein POVWA2_008040 [Plasmodium ovale wallikeri]|uniref:Uncharacterized protein n=1 Tax=Plasmodium ovale wallikeri TaxID=864142 RepID=A0A1A8YKT1_PLAOA|nr:hypothetical protein POVWA1_008040 [Plasmodium ovale wallikeri]SBT32154.1 hypothetical protein POVWA2_008040 [Plasmodium ovale wallikeri]
MYFPPLYHICSRWKREGTKCSCSPKSLRSSAFFINAATIASTKLPAFFLVAYARPFIFELLRSSLVSDDNFCNLKVEKRQTVIYACSQAWPKYIHEPVIVGFPPFSFFFFHLPSFPSTGQKGGTQLLANNVSKKFLVQIEKQLKTEKNLERELYFFYVNSSI